MIQNNNSGNKIKENKYKILRMSLLLGNGDDKEETINNFEEAAREIDAMNDEVYLKELEGKFYDTMTLEEEEKKLTVLVDYIGGRVDQRLSLLEDFSNVTGYDLTDLPPIKYQERLEEYKDRLSYIKEYLDNTKNINKLNEEVNNLDNELNDVYTKKAKNEELNKKYEEELLNKFNSIIKNIDDFKDINQENAEIKLSDIKLAVDDSKKSLDIFNKSFATLNAAGISGEERKEYTSYVNNAKESYYSNKEIEYLLNLYIILNNKEYEFNKILSKRDSLNEIIYERMSLRKELNISSTDILESMYPITERQYDDISNQKENIDRIEFLINEIDDRKNIIDTLEKDNQKVEILSLLKEFCLIDTYDDIEYNKNDEDIEETPKEESDIFDNDIDLNNSLDFDINPDKEIEHNDIEISNDLDFETPTKEESYDNDSIGDIIEDNQTEEIDLSNVKDNQIISVTDAININTKDAIEKSNNVMKRVGEMLGVKADPTIQKPKEEIEEPIEDKTTEEVKKDEDIFDNNAPEVNIPSIPEKEEIKEDIFDNSKIETTTEPEETKAENDFNLTENIFMNGNFDADPEINSNQDVPSTSTIPENPLFSSSFADKTIDDVMAENKTASDDIKVDFWFSQEEAPMDLNSLPDIDNNTLSNNTFFGNTDNMPNLDFPSLDNQNTTNKEDA